MEKKENKNICFNELPANVQETIRQTGLCMESDEQLMQFAENLTRKH